MQLTVSDFLNFYFTIISPQIAEKDSRNLKKNYYVLAVGGQECQATKTPNLGTTDAYN